MFGNNPIRPPLKGDGSTLDIQEIFPTLQGEGPLAGVPAVFVRLGGCNLACGFCDTEFEQFSPWNLESILEEVTELAEECGARVRNLVVVTGGEPFRQTLKPLTDRLLDAGFDVQIETNGTLYQPLDSRVQIVCSPKTTTGTYARLREDILPHVTALKFIISAQEPFYGSVGEVGQTDYAIPVYVQPMDETDAEKNIRNKTLATEIAQRYGYRLSLQLHKLLGVA